MRMYPKQEGVVLMYEVEKELLIRLCQKSNATRQAALSVARIPILPVRGDYQNRRMQK